MGWPVPVSMRYGWLSVAVTVRTQREHARRDDPDRHEQRPALVLEIRLDGDRQGQQPAPMKYRIGVLPAPS
jgi:hypothetical protein